MLDIVLFGAGGFTGRQTVAYLARHAPRDLRWAVAGRHRDKLEAALAEAGAPPHVEILLADSGDQASIDALVSRTRIVLTTAGPYALYGTPVVDACVRFGTDYVDITGETEWVRALVDRYHARAAARAIRIVSFCGFDSVPSDLGSHLLIRHLQQHGAVTTLTLRAYFTLKGGGLNGGTAATMVQIAGSRAGRAGARQPASRLAPHYDRQAAAWVGPFVMGPINSWVVRRSARLHEQYGESYPADLHYREWLRYSPPLARAKATAATLAAGLLLGGLRHAVTRRAIAAFLPRPGTGPTERQMDNGWVRYELVAHADDGRSARLVMQSPGDAGNRSTVRFACESALALARDADQLPGGRTRGGILTPSTGLGSALVARLRRAGVTFDVISPAA